MTWCRQILAISLLGCVLIQTSIAHGEPGWFNVVRDGGADPTGTQDSSDALQQAVNSGKPVLIPRGTYDLKKPVTLTHDNTIIWGRPGGTTLKIDPSNLATNALLISTALSNIPIHGLTFDGTGSNAHRRMVYIDGGNNVIFDYDQWQHIAGLALVFSGATSPVTRSGVKDSFFSDIGLAWVGESDPRLSEAGVAIVFSNGVASADQGNFAMNNAIQSVGGDAVDIEGQGNFMASGNILDLQQKGWKPLHWYPSATYGVGGFYVYGSSAHVSLTNNFISGATGDCIETGGDSGTTIQSNIITQCGGAAIGVGSGETAFIYDSNTLTQNYQSLHYPYPIVIHQGAISFSCGATPCSGIASNGVIRNNTIIDNLGYPIWKQPPSGLYGKGVTLVNVQVESTNNIDCPGYPLCSQPPLLP